MSQERSISSDHSSINPLQSYHSLNLDQSSDQINLNVLNLTENNLELNEQTNEENSDLSLINLIDNLVDNQVDNLMVNQVDNLMVNQMDNQMDNQTDNRINNQTDNQTDNNQTFYFHPSFLQFNSSLQSNQTNPDSSIELNSLNNSILTNQTTDVDQIKDTTNQINNNNLNSVQLQIQNLTGNNSVHKTSFEWEIYNDRNKVLKELRENRKFIDIQLIAEDNYSEYVHSTVISSLGKGLANFIFTSKQDPKTPCIIVDSDNLKNHIKQIHLKGVSGSVLKVIVNCAYTGYIESDDKKVVWSIINVAENFEMFDVLRACCTYLIYQLNIDNCIKLLHLGVKFKHKLRTAAWNFIRLKFDRIVNECADYIHLSIDELVNLLEDDHLNTISGEQIVWLGICRWILADLLSRAKYLNKLLEKLRFGRIPLEYLEEIIIKEPLLIEINNGAFDENETNEIISNKNNELSLLKNVSTIKTDEFVSNKEIKTNELITSKTSRQNNDQMNNSSKTDHVRIKKLNQNNLLNFDNAKTSNCLNLVKRMICIRQNKQNQYKTDNRNLLVDLNPYFVRPRVPAEVVFVIGGWQDNMITTLMETYDVRTNMWFESHISLEYTRAYHGLEILNGLLYVIGGTNGNKTLSSMHCFNPNNGKWYERANMYERRCYVNTTVLNELIYAMGGHNGAQRLNTVERYEYKTNQWIQTSPMNLARSDASAVTYDNKIYIAGGLNEHVQNTVEFYNPIDDTWTFVQPMRYQRNSLSLVLYAGCLFALGGSNGSSRLNTVEKYDFNTGVWTLSKPMRLCRSTFSACVLEDKLYVFGGHDQHSQIKSVEYYDIQTDQWYEVENLKKTRSGFNLCCYKSFTVSSRFTYSYCTEQLLKNKKNISKKKGTVKNNESTLQNQLNNRVNRKDSIHPNPSMNLNRFRRRRNRFRMNNFYSNNQRNLRNIELSRTNMSPVYSNSNAVERRFNNRSNVNDINNTMMNNENNLNNRITSNNIEQNHNPNNRQEINYFIDRSELNLPLVSNEDTETIINIDASPSFMTASSSRDEINTMSNNESSDININLPGNMRQNLQSPDQNEIYPSTSQLNVTSLTVSNSSSSTASLSNLQISTASNHLRSYEQLRNRNQFFETRSLNNEQLVDQEDEPEDDLSNFDH